MPSPGPGSAGVIAVPGGQPRTPRPFGVCGKQGGQELWANRPVGLAEPVRRSGVRRCDDRRSLDETACGVLVGDTFEQQ
jgi:hypothetical protein